MSAVVKRAVQESIAQWRTDHQPAPSNPPPAERLARYSLFIKEGARWVERAQAHSPAGVEMLLHSDPRLLLVVDRGTSPA